MIYRNQIFQPVAVGDRMKATSFALPTTIGLTSPLQGQGYDEVKKSAERLLEILRKNGNALPVNDDSKPEKDPATYSDEQKKRSSAAPVT